MEAAAETANRRPTPPPHVVPRGTSELGMYLFLASLGLLFAASMLGYGIFRIMATMERQTTVSAAGSVLNAAGDSVRPPLPLQSLSLPWPLWFSSGVILLSGWTLHRAVQKVRVEKLAEFRQMLVATLLLSMLFLIVQTPALIALVMERQADHATALSGFLFFLILLHALHVVGGVVPLFKVTLSAYAGRYDHEHYGPVKMLAMYWHFLDLVWIVMFGVFLALG
ncbi:cytochrome c oxidase subunit 3 [Phycisphaera mikurensis]|nr:cytochrome c oxidase subunit 3 [Phycisphaera mikurensis]MBB6442741.1 heme/copper-type cytochrome/quinol oxidase subunit 3 [Phycisphaera mikurensis]